MRIRRNANAAVGVALLVIGAVALLAGMDTPATGGDRIVILGDDGRVVHEVDTREIERLAEDMGELGTGIAEDVIRMLEDLDLDIDVEVDGRSRVWVHGDDGAPTHFDAERFEENMERFARRLEERLEHLDDQDFEHLGRMAERISRRVERQVERALRDVERHERRGGRDHLDRYDRRDEREAGRSDDSADAIRDEIRVLERELERLQRRLERLEDR
ncbi:MAG TPA: hypothetical protein VKA86_01425 [Candidatus Krumholzibacteria bacterium]|nr:hypothetical protein [Candidatus Krumholzibacteria bacterium]